MLRYVKSPEEIERLQNIYAAPAFMESRSLSIMFETDPDVIRAVLPPPLEPADQPIVTAIVSETRRSNCAGPFIGGLVNVMARYEDIVGNYCLTMPMSTDHAIIFGRELYGEPKKEAHVVLTRDGDKLTGTVERYGITYMELQAEMGQRVEAAGDQESTGFFYKYMPSSDGKGLDHDPLLIKVSYRVKATRGEMGTGTVIFRESVHDPVIDIPILNTLGAAYGEGDIYTTSETLCSVDQKSFLPYAFGKIDAFDAFG